jgi:molybdopterin molybdotransferase
LITVSEARAIVLENGKPMPTESVGLMQARGRTLRETVTAMRPQPPFAASAMDGYAVRSVDTPGRLRVIGEAGAGRALPRPIAAGECARIFTGAPLPDGADAILIQEDAERTADEVVAPAVAAGRHVRSAGVDFVAGATLVDSGCVLDAGALALAAAAGLATLCVTRRPRIAILSGGDEIVPPGTAPAADQIFDSVSYGVAALAEAWGAAPLASITPLADDAEAIAARMNAALGEADLVVVIGGASVGDHDHARPAVKAIGAELLFEKVALRPGKPTWFARRDGRLVLGLPGNPGSAFVCARLFLRPLICRLLGGDPAALSHTRAMRSRTPLAANGGRETYLRAAIETDKAGQMWATAADKQDSSLITVFAAAQGLIVREANAEAVAAGGAVDVLDL